MRQTAVLVFAVGFAFFAASGLNKAEAQCTLPYQLTNGQTADASQVMANFNTLQNCATPGGSANALQYNNGAGGFGGVGPLTNGQVVIGSTGNAPQPATLTAGPGIAITDGPGSITISGSSSALPTLVQSAFTRLTSGTSGTVTLSSTPTPGNLLVAIASGYGGGTTIPAVPSTFYGVYSNINSIASAQAIVVGARVVQSGDGTTWSGFVGGNGGDVFGIFELSNAHAVQAISTQGHQSGMTWPFFAGSAGNAYTFFVLENDGTNGYSSISGATLVFDGTSTNSNHPSLIATVGGGSAANAVVTYTGSTFGNSLFTTVAVVP